MCRAVELTSRAERGPPFSVSPGSSALLEQSLAQAVRAHDLSMQRLRDAVDACVAELHGRGMPPEAVIVTIKALLRHTAGAHPPPGYEPSRSSADGLMDEVVRWTIAAYYRLEVPPHA